MTTMGHSTVVAPRETSFAVEGGGEGGGGGGGGAAMKDDNTSRRGPIIEAVEAARWKRRAPGFFVGEAKTLGSDAGRGRGGGPDKAPDMEERSMVMVTPPECMACMLARRRCPWTRARSSPATEASLIASTRSPARKRPSRAAGLHGTTLE